MSADDTPASRAVPLPHVVVIALAAMAGGGGAGTAITDRGTTAAVQTLRAELGQARAEILGELSQLRIHIDDHSRRLLRVETRLDAHEDTPAHRPASLSLDALVKRVEALEEGR